MSFDTTFQSALADILSAVSGVGVSAVFTPATGDPVQLDVAIDKSTELQPSGNFQTWEIGTTIEYSLQDISREAVTGETFTIGTIVYTVRAIEKNDGYTVKAVVT